LGFCLQEMIVKRAGIDWRRLLRLEPAF
jgi:hypothetical protein